MVSVVNLLQQSGPVVSDELELLVDLFLDVDHFLELKPEFFFRSRQPLRTNLNLLEGVLVFGCVSCHFLEDVLHFVEPAFETSVVSLYEFIVLVRIVELLDSWLQYAQYHLLDLSLEHEPIWLVGRIVGPLATLA